MTQRLAIDLPMEAIRAFCERHGIARLSLFGSVLRDDFGPESDVDVLVEFAEGRKPGLAFFVMGDELAELLGRPVDFVTADFVNARYRAEVRREAMPVYVAA